jgi:hypothetical protein
MRELCRVSIEEREYQNWLEEDNAFLEEALLNEADAEYDSLLADED